MTTTTKRLTLEEFLRLPGKKPALEYECGEVIPKTMGTRLHTFIQGMLSILVMQFVLKHGLGEAGPELRCIFGPTGRERSYVPDFAFIARARLPMPTIENVPFHGAPDLAVEITSPDDRPGRVRQKIRTYLRYGVRIVWLVSTNDYTVTVHMPDSESIVLKLGDMLDAGDVIPGLRFRVDDLFPASAR